MSNSTSQTGNMLTRSLSVVPDVPTPSTIEPHGGPTSSIQHSLPRETILTILQDELTNIEDDRVRFVNSICIDLLNLRYLILDFYQLLNKGYSEDIFYFLDHFETLYYTAALYNQLKREKKISTILDFKTGLLYNFDTIFDNFLYRLGIINFIPVDKNRTGGFYKLALLAERPFGENLLIHFEIFYSKLINDLDHYEENPLSFGFPIVYIPSQVKMNNNRKSRGFKPYGGGKSKTHRKYKQHSKKQKRFSRHRITKRRSTNKTQRRRN